jgi:hypothetical protein
VSTYQPAHSVILMKKRKSDAHESGAESKRRKRLEDAKRFIERTRCPISEAAIKFKVGRNSLGTFLRTGFQNVGRPPFLKSDDVTNLRAYLSALDSVNLQQSVLGASNIMQKITKSPVHPSAPTVRKYVQETGLFLRKPRAADQGRLRVIESIEDFVHYYDIMEEKLDAISHDPRRIFNVDEVGIQTAERSFQLITGRQYLNKNLNETSGHVTLVLCSSPFGEFMTPHFLFQHAESSQPPNLLSGTVNSTCEYNSTGYQDEHTWKNWMNLFILWKNRWLEGNGLCKMDPVLLLLDGHYSHLDLDVLFTAAMNSIEIVCMLAHATHLVQPNDQAINKRLKQNLDAELAVMAANSLTLGNFEIAHFCEKALANENMKRAITSSYRQVIVVQFVHFLKIIPGGAFPFQ